MPELADMSLEQIVSMLPEDEQNVLLDGRDEQKLAYDWKWNGRPSQLLPVLPQEGGDSWSLAVALAGRGFGKTLMGAQWIRQLDTYWPELGRDRGHMRFFLLGRTSADVRDVMLEGPSGLMNVWPPSMRDKVRWIPSRRRVELPGGSVGLCFSGEEPDQLRGPAAHVSWCDELAAFKQMRSIEGEATAWENLRIGTRLGNHPQTLATTTPKRVPIVREILKEARDKADRVLLRRGKTVDNAYLSKDYLEVLLSLYAGTALGAQELEGEVLDAVAGATTTEGLINQARIARMPEGIRWIKLVGVDPSVAERPHDECGIVVVYISNTLPILQRHAFVVDDLSRRVPPAEWAEVALRAAHEHNATIVVETNQGGALVKQVVRLASITSGIPMPPIRETWSSKAKSVRAEPLSAAYAHGRVHHVNVLPELEDQLVSWVAGDSNYSPDRMDALAEVVGAGLFPEALIRGLPGSATIRSVAHQRLAITRQVEQPRSRLYTGGRYS